MRGSQQIIPPHPAQPPDDPFQKLLLAFTAAASRALSPADILKVFCSLTRSYFQASGSYVWRLRPPDQLLGAAADGWMAEHFRRLRLRVGESTMAREALRRRRAVYTNVLSSTDFRIFSEFHARSALAVPLIARGEILGAALYLATSDAPLFAAHHQDEAGILADELRGALEAIGFAEPGREDERRQASAEAAEGPAPLPEVAVLVSEVADRVRALLRAPLVAILVGPRGECRLWALATENPDMAPSVRARFRPRDISFAADLAERAIAAGAAINVAIDPAAHSLADLVSPGTLVACPFQTATKAGAVLVYPRREGPFSGEEKSLLPVISGFAASAVRNAELYANARAQLQELSEILRLRSELESIASPETFFERFLPLARAFLGFTRILGGLVEGEKIRLRWSDGEGSRPGSYEISEGLLMLAMKKGEILCAENLSEVPDIDHKFVADHRIRQFLALPLLRRSGELIGMFALLDRIDGSPIKEESIAFARALAAEAARAVEIGQNLLVSESRRRKAEALTALAVDAHSLIGDPASPEAFLARAAEIMEVEKAALFTVSSGTRSALFIPAQSEAGGASESFRRAVLAALASQPEPIVLASADDIAGPELASGIGWKQIVAARLEGSSGELLGALCLADCGRPLTPEDLELVASIARQASVSLENGRFFTRMERANRHWVEIFDAIPDFVVAHDEAWNVLRVNRALSDFIGVEPHQLIGVNMAALLTSGDPPASGSCPFCRRGGQAADEYFHSQLERSYLVSTSQVHAASSEGLQTVHVLKDITDRHEAERRYRELFDNIQEGLFFASPDGRFIEVNDALVRILGHDSREHLLHCDPRQQIFAAPERHRNLFAEIDRQGTLREHEEVLRRKDGSAVHVLVNAFAVRDAQRRVLQYRGLMLDITGLKAYQAELQRERDFSGKILNNTQSLILVVDTAGLVSYGNRRWQALGYQQPAILGRPLRMLVAEPKRPVLDQAYTTVLGGDAVDNLELQILRADGRVGHFSVNLSPMRDDQGQVTSIVVVMSDVTDAASLQAKLMHAEKMAAVGQLVSGVAHEVNNPLTAILGFADLLLENRELPESARKDLRVILQEAQRTKQIVQNLLSFAREMPPQWKAVDLNSILQRTIQLRAYDFHSRGVAVNESYEDDLPPVMGDSQQLQQVFLNILNNAYDAVRDSAEGPRIEISTHRQENFVEVTFRDNGHGISEPERIFDPFFTTKQVGEGTGLGLSICYGIVKEHGGEILCANNAGRSGAVFIVRLPGVNELASLSASAGARRP
ncbi:MAG: PAS domain S-box protein [Acidobacteria bacterium]|nr:PAS domain S-box protein [Acidobacteriota bacterium]